MTVPKDAAALSLPPVEEVERVLGLEAEDREGIKGLYNLDTRRVPALRVLGFQVLLAFGLLHDYLRFGSPDWHVFLPVAVTVEVYVVAAFFIIRAFFTRVRAFHLGTLFLGLDLVALHARGVRHRGAAILALAPLPGARRRPDVDRPAPRGRHGCPGHGGVPGASGVGGAGAGRGRPLGAEPAQDGRPGGPRRLSGDGRGTPLEPPGANGALSPPGPRPA